MSSKRNILFSRKCYADNTVKGAYGLPHIANKLKEMGVASANLTS